MVAFQPITYGRYRLVEKLGEGGMATVYRAVADGPQGFSRSFVVKRVLPEFSRDPTFTKMLVDEARLSGLLHHPAIVQVFELGQVGPEYYLAMEHLEGVDLAQVLKRCWTLKRKLPVGLVCYLISELAGALAYAHELTDDIGRPLHIIHRDVSPSNVMICRSGAVKLLDFGIAKASESIRGDQTRTRTIKGKVAYLSPEQADGLELDHRSDIFALGVVMYECLTTDRLFRGSNDLQTLRLVRQAQVGPPSKIVPDIPPEVDAIVLKMLARDPTDRYQDCAQIIADLKPIVHRFFGDMAGIRSLVDDLGPFVREQPSQTEEFTGPGVRQTKSQAGEVIETSLARPLPRRRWPYAAAAGLTLALLAVIVPRSWKMETATDPTSSLNSRAASSAAPTAPQPQIPEPQPAALAEAPPAPAPTSPVAEEMAAFQVKISSEPDGAQVEIDGRAVGTTPFEFEGHKPLKIRLSKSGFNAVNREITSDEAWHAKLARADKKVVHHTRATKSPAAASGRNSSAMQSLD